MLIVKRDATTSGMTMLMSRMGLGSQNEGNRIPRTGAEVYFERAAGTDYRHEPDGDQGPIQQRRQ